MPTDIDKTLKFLNKFKSKSNIAVVLGSGWQSFIDSVKDRREIPFSKIPFFPQPKVKGHTGNLILGKINNRRIFILQGRIHYYEGVPIEKVTYPIRTVSHLGVNKIILTAACGAVNPNLNIGDLVLIKDHINLMGVNPLIGNPLFIDLKGLYSLKLRRLAKKVARENKIKLIDGVYCGFSGPSYETPAEVKMANRVGADVVGMSLVVDAIFSYSLGMKVLAIAYTANRSSSNRECLTHRYVLEVGEKIKNKTTLLLKNIIKRIQ